MNAPDDTITRLRLIREGLLTSKESLRQLARTLSTDMPKFAEQLDRRIDPIAEAVGMISTLELEILTLTRQIPLIRFTPPNN